MELQPKKKVLFICWDNPRSNYLEGLFVPIFAGLTDQYEFHVLQFSWASAERREFLRRYCSDRGIAYEHISVITRPIAFLGKFLTVLKGARLIAKYLKANRIDLAMPRSTMPANMLLRATDKFPELPIAFDADGLPIEERVDFAGLKKGSLRYRELKKTEGRIIRKATVVLTRTDRATEYLTQSHSAPAGKFFRVINGRDETFFVRDENTRAMMRRRLGIPDDAVVLTYCGSLGPQYGAEQMLYVHRKLSGAGKYFLLIITNNPGYMEGLGEESTSRIVVSAAFDDIPAFLSAGDIALAIRQSRPSMAGVAPIKLGEYLLMGMPVIASTGIGDTDVILKDRDFCFLLSDYSTGQLDKASDWIRQLEIGATLRERARTFGEEHFSLKESVRSYRHALEKVWR